MACERFFQVKTPVSTSRVRRLGPREGAQASPRPAPPSQPQHLRVQRVSVSDWSSPNTRELGPWSLPATCAACLHQAVGVGRCEEGKC